MHCSMMSGELGGEQPGLPEGASLFAVEEIAEIESGDGGEGCGFRRGVGLAEDVGGADDGVLDVGAGLAFEAEGVFEVEGDDGVAGEAQHEVAERADGDLRGDGEAFGFVDLRVAGVDFGFGGGDELVEEVVGLDAEAFAAADFDVGLASGLLR